SRPRARRGFRARASPRARCPRAATLRWRSPAEWRAAARAWPRRNTPPRAGPPAPKPEPVERSLWDRARCAPDHNAILRQIIRSIHPRSSRDLVRLGAVTLELRQSRREFRQAHRPTLERLGVAF